MKKYIVTITATPAHGPFSADDTWHDQLTVQVIGDNGVPWIIDSNRERWNESTRLLREIAELIQDYHQIGRCHGWVSKMYSEVNMTQGNVGSEWCNASVELLEFDFDA